MIRLKKNFASLESSASKLYELSESDVSQMHQTLLEMYDDLFAYCKQYSLKMLAGGGTALGAIRHGGFIPWDDDMDLNMMRDEYETFIRHFNDNLGEKYDLLAPGYVGGACCFLMRIMKKNTTFINMIDEASPYPKGIYIDITPIDYVPKNKFVAMLKGFMADSLRFISYSVYWRQYRSQSLKEFMMHSDGKLYYQARIIIGTVFSFFSAERWFKIFDQFIQGKESDHITIAAGRKKYRGETYPIDVFFPARLSDFSDRKMYVVNDENKYMTQMYGNYMRIPDEEDREKHLCLKLDFCQSN